MGIQCRPTQARSRPRDVVAATRGRWRSTRCAAGKGLDATSLPIPGVLDALHTYRGPLRRHLLEWWKTPAGDLASYPPDSDQQQAAVTAAIDCRTGTLTVPARTTAVFVSSQSPASLVSSCRGGKTSAPAAAGGAALGASGNGGAKALAPWRLVAMR